MAQTALHPYLTFNGNCREAMTFYQNCLDADLDMSDFGSSQMDVPEEAKKSILHARLSKDALVLMASDTMPHQPVVFGSNISLSVDCISKEQVDLFYHKLSEGGSITMPVADTFWGAYFGMIIDKFGVAWMFNYDYPKA